MSSVVVVEFLTLDGVMEAPGFEEHRTGRNGWAIGRDDAELAGVQPASRSSAPTRCCSAADLQHLGGVLADRAGGAAAWAERITAAPEVRRLEDASGAGLGEHHHPPRRPRRRRSGDQGQPGEGDLVLYGSADLVAGCSSSTSWTSCGSCSSRCPREREAALPRRGGPAAGCASARRASSGVVLLTYERQAEQAAARGPRWDTPGRERRRSFRAAEDTDRVLATVLFTDIVDSTGRAAAAGDREWRRTLDRHDEAARAEVKRWGGQLVKSTGDGILAGSTPPRALRSAFGLRSAARRLGLELRAAIHTGEVEVRGDDVGGIAVHIASRVLATADPGRWSSRGRCETSSPAPDRVPAAGVVALRGVPDAWELFAVSPSARAEGGGGRPGAARRVALRSAGRPRPGRRTGTRSRG